MEPSGKMEWSRVTKWNGTEWQNGMEPSGKMEWSRVAKWNGAEWQNGINLNTT